MNFKGILAVSCVSLLAMATSPTQSQATENSATLPDLLEIEAPIVVETDDHRPVDQATQEKFEEEARTLDSDFADRQASAKIPAGFAGSGGGISVTFNSTDLAPSNVQTVVNNAVSQWDDVLATNPNGPIEIEFFWRSLGSTSLLGYAGPDGLYQGSSLPTNYVYPAALANTLLGTDANGPSRPEIQVVINSDLASTNRWYISSDTNPASYQIDLHSVVLHEVGHGLGFLGSAQDNGSGPALNSSPYIYDSLAYKDSTQLVDHSDPNGQLTSNDLTIDIGGNNRWELYSPTSWMQGSSFSHFNESTYPTSSPGSLMTPILSSGVANRDLDAPILGLLQREGWTIIPKAAKPTLTKATTSGDDITLQWNRNFNETGLPPTLYYVEAFEGTDRVGLKTVSGSSTSSTLTDLDNGTYRVRLTPAASNGLGTPVDTIVTVEAGTQSTPGKPSGVSISGSGTNRTLHWNAPTGDVSGYRVERSFNNGSWDFLKNTTSRSTALALNSNGTYKFRVHAYNSSGASAFATSPTVTKSTTTTTPTTPSAPSYVRQVPLDGQISRLYKAYFLRFPDKDGFTYWRTQRASGMSLEAISQSFANSPEFKQRYGNLTNTAFVNLIYKNVLNRTPDNTGKTHWTNQLNKGTTRGQVMTGFSESPEYITKTKTVAPNTTQQGEISRLYKAYFLRAPDSAGLTYWLGVRETSSLETISQSFANSPEFKQRYGNLTNTAFVNLIYKNVLNRTPDNTGKTHWTNQLNKGTTRGQVMTGFSESPEYIIKAGYVP